MPTGKTLVSTLADHLTQGHARKIYEVLQDRPNEQKIALLKEASELADSLSSETRFFIDVVPGTDKLWWGRRVELPAPKTKTLKATKDKDSSGCRHQVGAWTLLEQGRIHLAPETQDDQTG